MPPEGVAERDPHAPLLAREFLAQSFDPPPVCGEDSRSAAAILVQIFFRRHLFS
jgi:hypothetical protein